MINPILNEKLAIHEPCGYSLDLVSSFSVKENKHSFYRGKDCDKKFFKELKEICTRIVDYEQKEMASSTDRKKNYEGQKNATYVKKGFTTTKTKRRFTNYIEKLEIIIILQENLEELPTVFVI